MQQQCTTALKNAKKIFKKIKKSDLNQNLIKIKKTHFFDFFLKIMIFFPTL